MSDRAAAVSTPEIPPREPAEACPLSFAQQRLWFLDQLEPGGLYNVGEALRLCGPLDVDALRRALDAVVARHEALRTIFRSVDGEPMQVVMPPAPVACPVVDVSGEPDETRRRIDEELGRPFDLARDPMLRALLLREGPDRHVLVLTMHHIATDGWSNSILFRDLGTAYVALRRGSAPALPALRVGYTDFAVWQRRRFSGRALDAELAYWRQELAEAPLALDLPTDRPRAAVPAWRGATHAAALPPELASALRFLGRKERTTLFMTLLAAFQTLLHRYSGQDDVLVGTPIANRPSVETEDLVGFFANTLVLRARFAEDPSFRELLARVRETALGAFDHQELPFERLVEELRPERSPTHNPLFQTMFALQNAPREPLRLEGIAASPIDVAPRLAKFDLALYASETPDGVRTTWEYNTALFDAPRIERMARHFAILLAGIAADPGRPVSSLPMMEASERRTIVDVWAGARAAYPPVPVTALFEEQAARRPDAPALDFRGGRWTYAELNAQANRIAHALRAHGVRPGSRVGLALERSPAMIAALIGIGKAGGAYVPLDPEYPEERLAWMRDDAGLAALVGEAPAGTRIPVIAPARERDALDRLPDQNPPPEGDAGALACLLYTSGSTGTPKAVAVAHRGIVRLVRGARYADFSERQVFLHASSLAFDASTFEIWGALANGARLVLADPGTPTLAELEATIRRHGVTTLWLTAGLFHLVVDERPSLLAPLEQLLAGGDVLSPPHVARALARFPGLRLVNGYGPTEGTTFTCCHPVTAADAAAGPIPIGRPIENTRVYILDRSGRPAPVGVPGELHAGGDGVALGYWNRPESTAERFVPDPFSADRGARLFRTGDRARWREDGTVEFLGRLDAQVKVRGFRVEPAEVERALEEHPDVRQAVVEARPDERGERALVAWLVPRDGRRIAADEIRRWTLGRLPRYLAPSRFVGVESLPLTAQGKVDRRALPEPPAGTGSERISAHDAIELALVRIWEDVLGVRPVSVRDNFFALGGHSLLAVRMFARVENALGRRLPLATLFQAPTIEQLASVMREEGWSAPWSSLVVIQGGGARPPFFCVPGVGGNVVGFHTLARRLGADQPVYGLQARGLDGVAEPDTTVEEMAEHYLEQMRAVVPRGPYYLGGASFGGKVAFEMARRLEREGERVALLALFDTFAPGSREAAPLRAVVRRGLARFFARVDYHVDNLLLQRQRGEYIRKKARTVRRRIRSRLWQVAYRAFAERSRPMPRALRSVREAGYLANRRYVAEPCGSTVTLFRAAVRSVADATGRDMGWGRLARGGVEVHHVAGDHENMLVEPHVGVLARELRAAIDRAQRRTVADLAAEVARRRTGGPA